MSRLYKAEYVSTDEECETDEFGPADFEPAPDPAGWAEHCLAVFGEYKPFFLPSDRKIFRSRSAAQNRVDLINFWAGDGTAALMECTPEWVPVEEANRRRKQARNQVRIDKLRAKITELEASK